MIRRWWVQQQVHRLTRTFPTVRVVVSRATMVYDDNGQGTSVPLVVYSGDALVAPQSGQVQVFGLGQTEQQSLTLLIAGRRDIRQGDTLVYGNRTYVVQDAPDVWQSYRRVTLTQKGQVRT